MKLIVNGIHPVILSALIPATTSVTVTLIVAVSLHPLISLAINRIKLLPVFLNVKLFCNKLPTDTLPVTVNTEVVLLKVKFALPFAVPASLKTT